MWNNSYKNSYSFKLTKMNTNRNPLKTRKIALISALCIQISTSVHFHFIRSLHTVAMQKPFYQYYFYSMYSSLDYANGKKGRAKSLQKVLLQKKG